MRKPEGYDTANAFTGEGLALPAGGYICRIVKAEETTSNSGSRMIVLLFDIAEGEHAGFFRQQFERAKQSNPDAKWNGIFRQNTEGKSLPFFKGMVTGIEISNDFKWDFDEAKLKGKLFGGLFGREQYRSDGKLRWSTKCQYIRTVKVIKEGKFEIPLDKPLASANISYDMPPTGNVTVIGDDDDLPF